MHKIDTITNNRQEVIIFLVEDDPGHARLIKKNLRRSNIMNKIIVAENGRKALDYLFCEGEYAGNERHPLLVLLDLNLPVLDGYQVLKRMKEDERTRRIPVIILTTTDDSREVSRCYDLGCSLGAASLAMAEGARDLDCRIIGIDNAPEMLARARRLVDGHPIDLVCADVREFPIVDASMVVLNFTLQFLDRDQRQTLINQIAAGMRTGGILIISEKICFEDEQEQADQTVWHHDFKRTQGYSELEIAQKRNALEDVLRPETEAAHFKRMELAGLTRPRRWFQCFSFASYIAFK